MPVEFFSTSPSTIDTRLNDAFNAARDVNGEALFPDHTVPGTPGYNLRMLWRRLLLEHYREANSALSMSSPRTARGGALDDWGRFLSMPRRGATKSNGTLLITSQQTGTVLESLLGTRRLVEGTRLIGGTAAVRLLSDAVIPAGEREVQVAVEIEPQSMSVNLPTGTQFNIEGNHPLRAVLSLEAITAIDGGQPIESDDQYRFRLMRALRDPSSYEGFLAEILGHEDVADVEFEEARYGPGTIEVFVHPSIAFPPNTLRSELEALYRGPGRAYIVFPAYEAVALRIRAEGGAEAQLKSTAVDFINNLEIGQAVILSQLESALLVTGANDAQVVAIRRGMVDEEGELIDTHEVPPTNLTPSLRAKWFSRTDWITICR